MQPFSKVALITGGARRIGAAIATYLHARGYAVAVHAHHASQAQAELVAALEAKRPGSTLAVQADLRERDAPAALMARCLERFQRLDALVNNASSFYPTPLAEATPEQWDDLFALNARAPFFLAQAAAPHLRAQHGAIVNITDLYARQPLAQHPLYCASKSALDMLTRTLALELAPQVRVNAIAPGAILWPEQGKSEPAQRALLVRTPLARLGTPEEVASTVHWLLDGAEYVTGHTVQLDGGRGLT